MNKNQQIFTKARELIADPANWSKGTLYRDQYGKPIGTYLAGHNPGALVCSYCLAGALRIAELNVVGDATAALQDYEDQIARIKFMTQFVPAPYKSLVGFNDVAETTHAMVLQVMDKAIAASTP